MKNILLLPGWMDSLKLYNNIDTIYDVQIGRLNKKYLSAEYIVGLSLSTLVILQNIDDIKGKVILINPPIPKRSIFIWLINWIRFATNEGLLPERQKFIKIQLNFYLK